MKYSRKAWGARRPAGTGYRLNPLQVEGVVLHWPAMSAPLDTPAEVMAALRGWQRYHMDTHQWSDIAYSHAIDQRGNRYRLRGFWRRSGANGNTSLNRRYGALLLVLAPGEEPSAAMLAEARRVIRGWRRRFPRARAILGHGQVRPGGTACPGPAVAAAIKAGRFEP